VDLACLELGDCDDYLSCLSGTYDGDRDDESEAPGDFDWGL
jgi:hypothetical protein